MYNYCSYVGAHLCPHSGQQHLSQQEKKTVHPHTDPLYILYYILLHPISRAQDDWSRRRTKDLQSHRSSSPLITHSLLWTGEFTLAVQSIQEKKLKRGGNGGREGGIRKHCLPLWQAGVPLLSLWHFNFPLFIFCIVRIIYFCVLFLYLQCKILFWV